MKSIVLVLCAFALSGITAECELNFSEIRTNYRKFMDESIKCEIGHFKEEVKKLRAKTDEFIAGISDECYETEAGKKVKSKQSKFNFAMDFMDTFDQEMKDGK